MLRHSRYDCAAFNHTKHPLPASSAHLCDELQHLIRELQRVDVLVMTTGKVLASKSLHALYRDDEDWPDLVRALLHVVAACTVPNTRKATFPHVLAQTLSDRIVMARGSAASDAITAAIVRGVFTSDL